jgi:dTDP-4-amino-4,6-dideoxygalactose transaminase
MSDDKKIYVTQPFLPPLSEFIPHLEKIWESKMLTNNGPYHKLFEEELAQHLGIENVALFTNATIALITALQALRISGEVITTPYSFVATSHALDWNGVKPVFVDIDPATCNIDPARIESAITTETKAILAVHCYGNPCAVEEIQKIADVYGLKVIYDAAHAFGVKYKGQSVLNYGDFSILSFHATKVLNTFEGGALVCPDEKTKQRIDYLKNFGFADEVTVMAPGINGKMNEFSAALGITQLGYIDEVIKRRAAITEHYREQLADIAGVHYWPPMQDTVSNYAYFPIRVGPEYPLSRDQLYDRLMEAGIYARRYFYPLISEFPMYRHLQSATAENLPCATQLAAEILCLPIYPDLERADQERVIAVLKSH